MWIVPDAVKLTDHALPDRSSIARLISFAASAGVGIRSWIMLSPR